MKKLVTLLVALSMLLGIMGLASAEEAAYDLGGNTVKVRLWDSPNPYAEDVSEVDKEKWLPIYEGLKEKYNVNFEFYTTTTEWGEMPNEWIMSVASGTPAWHITNNFSVMWLPQMVANKAVADVKAGVDTLDIPQGLKELAVFSGVTAGFNTGYPGTEVLTFNRKMIKDAGMEYDPGEMFKMGKWSYDDFYAYMTELQSKLPEDTYAFFIDPYYWAIFAPPGNNTMMVNTDFTVNMATDPYIESFEALKKLFDAKVVRPANTNDAGNPDYWGTPAATFDQGVEVAMTHRAMWQVGTLNSNQLDWGIVPYPWGSSVKLGTEGDYTTLSEEYHTAYYDMGVMGVMLEGVEKDFPGLEKDYVIKALTNLTYDLFVDDEAKERLAKEAAEPAQDDEEIDIGSFQDELSAELYAWMNKRVLFNPLPAIGGLNLWVSSSFDEERQVGMGGINRIIYDKNLPIRATFEAAAVELETAFKDAGFLK